MRTLRYARSLSAALIGGALFLAASVSARAGEIPELPVLARVGPWPAVSQLIGYRGRLWFVNSVKGRNHNSADIHSYDPRSGSAHYERHLFSQGAGQPLVSGGLLYWPFEDSRASLAWGEYMVTDGTHWRLGVIPTARIYHSHAMASLGPTIVAATSAWRAGLQISRDSGASWHELYDHPTPARRVSRIVALAATGDTVFAQLIDRGNHRLLRFDGDAMETVPGWPRDRPIVDLAAWGDVVYGLVREAGGITVWRSNGRTSTRMFTPPEPWEAHDITAGTGGLWLVSAESGGGTLWHSRDGAQWRAVSRLAQGTPHQVAMLGEHTYVGGAGTDGRGILWGPAPPAQAEDTGSQVNLPRQRAKPRDLAQLGDRLDQALHKPASYSRHGAVLRDLVYGAAQSGAPAAFFSERLTRPIATHELSLIGGDAKVSADEFGRWILLWGMAVGGRGRVPLDLISAPWTTKANRSQKYFELAPMAIWTAANLNQRDAATITALIRRLENPGDPTWLKGDIVGALGALTGARFGYDSAAWRTWWDIASTLWQK